MKLAYLTTPTLSNTSAKSGYFIYVFMFLSGVAGTLGFAPFHMPGLTLISLALLFSALISAPLRQVFYLGFTFGLGYFGFGVSWVIISIHDYGQLNYFLAGIATLAFIFYLALFPALLSWSFKRLSVNCNTLFTVLLFGSLWCLSEYIRSFLFTGFPWLLVGTSQIDTPLKYLAPIVGQYGLGFLCAMLAALLALAVREQALKRIYFIGAFVLIMLLPMAGKYIHWTKVSSEPVSLGVIQGNLSMREKWDEALFWKLLKYYEINTKKLLGKQLIILPESAIPLPANYLEEYLENLNQHARHAKSSLILGILQPSNESETRFYNSIMSLGLAAGEHVKRRLVPFGEYIPQPFVAINHWMNLPEPNILPGKPNQELMTIDNHPIASLICYEIAYPNLVRSQMPAAQWIVSISDNGWFGRSLASYQQLQMAQMISLLTGRYQVVANNDGLSSVINEQGEIIDSLPPFSSGILVSKIYPAEGTTPWVYWSEYPALIFCMLIVFGILVVRLKQK